MGFKFKRVDLVAGSADFPTGTSEANKVSRSKTIVSKCAEAIINCNCGWGLDITRSTSLTDYTYLAFAPSPSSAMYPALFLKNTTSGCKIIMSYFATEPYWGAKDYSGDDFIKVQNDRTYASGLCISMIPGNSSSVFGSVGSGLIPSDATRIVSTCITSSNSSSVYCCFGGNPLSGTFSWGLFVTETCIAIACGTSQTGKPNLGTPVLVVGKIFGSLFHSEDNTNQSQYGSLLFRASNTAVANSEGITSVISDSYRLYNSDSSTYSFLGLSPDKNSSISAWIGSANVFGAVARANGTWISGTDGSSYGVTLYPVDVFQLSGYIYNSTSNGKSRWVPYVVRCVTSNLSTYGVVDGDGMKGYLDTDLFRCALGTYGQQFDNGDFICVDSTNNFLIGWDSTNTDSIAGT